MNKRYLIFAVIFAVFAGAAWYYANTENVPKDNAVLAYMEEKEQINELLPNAYSSGRRS